MKSKLARSNNQIGLIHNTKPGSFRKSRDGRPRLFDLLQIIGFANEGKIEPRAQGIHAFEFDVGENVGEYLADLPQVFGVGVNIHEHPIFGGEGGFPDGEFVDKKNGDDEYEGNDRQHRLIGTPRKAERDGDEEKNQFFGVFDGRTEAYDGQRAHQTERQRDARLDDRNDEQRAEGEGQEIIRELPAVADGLSVANVEKSQQGSQNADDQNVDDKLQYRHVLRELRDVLFL